MTEIEKTPEHQPRSLLRDNKGAGFTEYLVLLIVVVVAGIAIWTQFGGTIRDRATNADTSVRGM